MPASDWIELTMPGGQLRSFRKASIWSYVSIPHSPGSGGLVTLKTEICAESQIIQIGESVDELKKKLL